MQEAVTAALRESRLPPHLPPDLAEDLPEGPGVYLFRGEGGALLYVGKSRNLRSRVIEHFASEHRSSKESKLTRQVRAVEWIETGGELGALLLESRLVKELAPSAQPPPAQAGGTACVRLEMGAAGLAVRIEPLDATLADGDVELYGPFRTERDARRALEGKAREAGLCLKVMGLEHGEGSCFGLAGRPLPWRVRRPRAAGAARCAPAARAGLAAPQAVAVPGADRHPRARRRRRRRAARHRPLAPSRHRGGR